MDEKFSNKIKTPCVHRKNLIIYIRRESCKRSQHGDVRFRIPRKRGKV
jgi:hypothetical protein